MAEMTTFSVKHRYWNDALALTSWTIQEEPSNRISWTPHAQARPRRLRKVECREVLKPGQNTLPGIHIHGTACRCTQTQTENQLQDTLLAAKISALSRTLCTTTTSSSTTPRPPPTPYQNNPTRVKRSLSRSRLSPSTTSLLSTLTRLFSPSSPTSTPILPPPSLPLQADLCIGCADLDINKVARYLVPVPRDDTVPLPVNVDAPNHLGMTPLMAAVRSPAAAVRSKAHVEMVRFLVEGCGADVDGVRLDRVTGVGESVLSMACVVGAVEVVRFLVGRGAAAVNARLPSGRGIGSLKGVVVGKGQTALHVAVLADRPECVEVLVGEGKADVDAVFDAAEAEQEPGTGGGFKGLRGRTKSVSWERRGKGPRHPVSALHLAHGSYACTKVLLEAGANVGARDGHGRTPLHWAAEAGNADVVRLLVSAGADTSAASDDGTTALGAVVALLGRPDGKQGRAEVLRVLLGAESRIGRQEAEFVREKLVALQEWCAPMDGAVEDGDVLQEKGVLVR
ncbi:Serine/threonine-protein phosphatase 6 regulatory ankyrin repeat subunit C [Parachaetomium inaequale]|uniref:Serine/threonine-protein phosphatase 6 regulatory ankyrin repeat subunit C n=1 Tax=Parachaetomium inaequale TaxID=2588326 RepID=A0AAN6PD38_9PEZI|nr:Serine/threonine-protein phosphatase 6 regulatory ankyrin repeat subunit C [Parachaetomium inaequale]